ncbi:MAG: 30S ribosomal protein S17 [Nanoarchaeota archaeon]
MAEKKNKQEKTQNSKKKIAGAAISLRGRVFEGIVTKKFPKRVVIEFERTIYVKKYERFYKKKVRIHSRLPEGIEVNAGDYVQARECRPLSKIINTVVTKKIRSTETNKEAK